MLSGQKYVIQNFSSIKKNIIDQNKESKTSPRIYSKMIFNKGDKTKHWGKDRLFTHTKKYELRSLSFTIHKINI